MAKYKTPKVEELLDAGVHFGHQTKRWHPKMEPYIFAVRKNIHIIDLEATDKGLKEACEFLFEKAKSGQQIIFVGTKKQAREVVENEAKRSGALYVTERWIGGTLTNFRVIKRNIDKLVGQMKDRESGELEKYTKKERLLIDREIEKQQRNIGGILTLNGDPAAMFVVDARRERTAIREAKRAGVPVVALVDTNSDPGQVDIVIPGNDDAIKSIAMILKVVSTAVEEGYKEFANKSQANKEPEAAVKPVESSADTAVQVSVDEAPRISDDAALDESLKETVEVLEEEVEQAVDEDESKTVKTSKEE
ncbi:MAG: 30S ribosomal protein S2 [candidate division WWE3 bacterium GW2011_GWA1_41_8]|uniref:Small ribosomal subunit protein uS2 n=4 Tax=Katanobacteria TaxID=422282 RepID=A0A0G0ZJJ6_UNCKA|nr:MAG: 30S ribosomal protein S2 [candidate division WWE3 bacterium GW2011_GWB1_41_6]KKS22206.1 MAG: 30S ribosomal protein S2 [candidate division WWE3 bacterium GW2011_GWA1_41_8]OGC56996.1 MAG: 30S ribosomal protein S2 [candidate division WWE3 bacterium RIFCSPLOWO2_01_FULL_41_9]